MELDIKCRFSHILYFSFKIAAPLAGCSWNWPLRLFSASLKPDNLCFSWEENLAEQSQVYSITALYADSLSFLKRRKVIRAWTFLFKKRSKKNPFLLWPRNPKVYNNFSFPFILLHKALTTCAFLPPELCSFFSELLPSLPFCWWCYCPLWVAADPLLQQAAKINVLGVHSEGSGETKKQAYVLLISFLSSGSVEPWYVLCFHKKS